MKHAVIVAILLLIMCGFLCAAEKKCETRDDCGLGYVCIVGKCV